MVPVDALIATFETADICVWCCVCVCVCGLLGDMAPSVCIVSLLDCSLPANLYSGIVLFWNIDPHMHTCEEACAYTLTHAETQ